VREDAEKRQKATRAKPGGEVGTRKAVEQIPQPTATADSRKTRAVRAKIAETNPKYIDLADRLYVEDREAFEQVQREERESGEGLTAGPNVVL